jgi:hypothetical protein
MSGKEIEPDKQQETDSDQPKMILKPILEGIHGSPLAYFEVRGLTGQGNSPDLSQRGIHRVAFCAP